MAQSGHVLELSNSGFASHACTVRQLHGRLVSSAMYRAACARVISAR